MPSRTSWTPRGRSRCAPRRRGARSRAGAAPLRNAAVDASLRSRPAGTPLSAASRQQLIHALGIRAALGFLHHETNQNALELLFAGKVSLRFFRVLVENFVDPRRNGRLVAD